MDYQAQWNAALQYIGSASLCYLLYRLASFHSLWLIPSRSLSHYQRPGSWALVTGASAGIGRGCAEELAARGSNVILLGHLPEQLEEVKQHINRESPAVEVKILKLDVTQAPISKVEVTLNQITDLPVTILVNNVGGVPAGLKYYVDQTGEELDRTIDLNARFMSHCTRIMLPVLAKTGPSLMMNVSSVGRLGMPFVVCYSGTKAFGAAISRGLARECRMTGQAVDVVAVLPVEVATEATASTVPRGTPNSREFGKAMMDYVPRAAARSWLELCPYWPHAVQMAVMEMLLEWAFSRFVVGAFKQKMAVLKADKRN